MSSRKAMIRTAKLLMSRLFQTNAEDDVEVVDNHVSLDDDQHLQEAETSQSLISEATGKRTPNPDLLYNALLCIKPTS